MRDGRSHDREWVMGERIPSSDFIIVKNVLLANWQGSLIDDDVVWVDAGVLDSQDKKG